MPGKDTVRQIERAIIQIARNLGRHNLGRAAERKLENLVNFSLVAVVDALGESRDGDAPATVGQIARRMDVDPSRASRAVSGAIRSGYARRVASQEDGRRSCLALTEKGEEFAAAIREMRLRYFSSHLKDWPEEDCAAFACLLGTFAGGADQRQSAGAAEPVPEMAIRGQDDSVMQLHAPPRARKRRQERVRNTRR
jgi:DNA-binding MarR family transcriptional regulator